MMKKLYIFLLLLFFKGALYSQTSSLDGLVLIGNKTGLESVSRKQLKGIFRGSQTIWNTNEEVIIVMPSLKADFANDFASSVLQMTQSALHRYWLELVFQGRADAPVFLNSSAEIVEYVKNNPGAIAVVKMSEKEVPRGMLIAISNR
jgi:ABC-type phosphate transport system substrate-binding protein